jgi:YD repeat-containing protein
VDFAARSVSSRNCFCGANNHVTEFAYNARGWVTQTTFPSTLAESYTYDLVGNLQSKTDRKNQTIQYVYDALYRLSSKTYPDSTAVEYAYDLVRKNWGQTGRKTGGKLGTKTGDENWGQTKTGDGRKLGTDGTYPGYFLPIWEPRTQKQAIPCPPLSVLC